MLRNIGIVAHVNAGKTTLSEQILFLTGKQGYLGDVEAGTATMDCQPQEQERGISISAAMSSVEWRGVTIHLIDTPGHVDFGPEIERALQVIDGVVVVLDGVRGVESQTESVWRYLDKYRIPRLIFVNKLDREFADYEACLESLRGRLGAPILSLELPLPEVGESIDLLREDCAVEAQSAMHSQARGRVIEACADLDADIMRDYVEGRHVRAERLASVLRRATLEHAIVPAFGGSALVGWGVDRLLDAVIAYLPGCQDRIRLARCGRELLASPSGPNHLVALIFKLVVEDEAVIGFVRIFQGALRVGDRVETSGGLTFIVPELWSMHALDRVPIEVAEFGAVFALPLPPEARSGQTIRTPGCGLALPSLDTSPPVLTMSVEPSVSEQRSLLERCVGTLVAQDPSLQLSEDVVTGGLLVSGMGELHLEIFAARVQAALPQPARLGRPGVRLAEAPSATAHAEGICQRSLGDRVLVARVLLAIAPSEVSGPAEIIAGPETANSPPTLVGGLLASLAEMCAQGLTAGRPIRGARIELLEVDLGDERDPGSVDLAGDALRLALQRVLKNAGSTVLEPWMLFQVDCPSESMSVVLAELRSRQADIVEVTPSYGVATIRGSIAMARVLGWSTSLRSVTKGKGELQLEFGHFAAKEP